MRGFLFVLLLLITSAGCITTKQAVDDYQRCMADAECSAQVNAVKSHSYVATETAITTSGIPRLADIIAVIVSSVVSFGFGVVKGRKLKG